MLKRENLLEETPHRLGVAIEIDVELAIGKSQQAALEIPVPLDQLHGLIGLRAAGLIVLQYPTNPSGLDRAEACVVVDAPFVQHAGREQ